jgi:hypothetical protein
MNVDFEDEVLSGILHARRAEHWMPRQMIGAHLNASGMTPRVVRTATNCLRALQIGTRTAHRNSRERITIKDPTQTSLTHSRLIDKDRYGRVRSRLRKHNLRAKIYGTLWHHS